MDRSLGRHGKWVEVFAMTAQNIDMDATRKIRFTLAYDGTDYHGWQIQPGFRTVQAAVCDAALQVLGCKTHVQGASRTDAGVHALGQVGLIATDHPIPVEDFQWAMNTCLPSDIRVLEAREAQQDFDVTGQAMEKLYRYTICTGRTGPLPRDARFCWHFPGTLDVSAMRVAAARQ